MSYKKIIFLITSIFFLNLSYKIHGAGESVAAAAEESEPEKPGLLSLLRDKKSSAIIQKTIFTTLALPVLSYLKSYVTQPFAYEKPAVALLASISVLYGFKQLYDVNQEKQKEYLERKRKRTRRGSRRPSVTDKKDPRRKQSKSPKRKPQEGASAPQAITQPGPQSEAQETPPAAQEDLENEAIALEAAVVSGAQQIQKNEAKNAENQRKEKDLVERIQQLKANYVFPAEMRQRPYEEIIEPWLDEWNLRKQSFSGIDLFTESVNFRERKLSELEKQIVQAEQLEEQWKNLINRWISLFERIKRTNNGFSAQERSEGVKLTIPWMNEEWDIEKTKYPNFSKFELEIQKLIFVKKKTNELEERVRRAEEVERGEGAGESAAAQAAAEKYRAQEEPKTQAEFDARWNNFLSQRDSLLDRIGKLLTDEVFIERERKHPFSNLILPLNSEWDKIKRERFPHLSKSDQDIQQLIFMEQKTNELEKKVRRAEQLEEGIPKQKRKQSPAAEEYKAREEPQKSRQRPAMQTTMERVKLSPTFVEDNIKLEKIEGKDLLKDLTPDDTRYMNNTDPTWEHDIIQYVQNPTDKKIYRKIALKYHPDKQHPLGDKIFPAIETVRDQETKKQRIIVRLKELFSRIKKMKPNNRLPDYMFEEPEKALEQWNEQWNRVKGQVPHVDRNTAYINFLEKGADMIEKQIQAP